MVASASFLSHQNATHCRTLWPTKDIFLSRIYIFTNIIFSAVGTVANFLLLLGLYKSKLTSQGTMKIVCSLACSDFCVSAFVIPTFLIAVFQRDQDCVMHLISAYVFFTFAINTANMLLILSTDRLLQISRPILYKACISRRPIQVVIICAWFASAVSAICIFFINPLTQVCVLLTTGMAFYAISVASYARILFVVHSHRKKIQTGSTSEPNNEAVITTSKRGLASTSCANKRITFRLQVEVFDNSPTRHENMSDPGNPCNTGKQGQSGNTSNQSNTAQVAILPTPRLQGAYCIAKRNINNPKMTQHGVSLLAVPEDLRINKRRGKARLPSQQSGLPDGILEEGKNETVQDIYHCANINVTAASKSRHSRLEPVNFTGKDAVSTVSTSKDIKITWTVAMVIITLFVCYVPYIWLAYLWAREEYKNNRHASQQLQSTYAWTLTIAFTHSSLNPIIMLARNKKLRCHVKEMLTQILS